MNKPCFSVALTALAVFGATVVLAQPPGRGNPEKMIERHDANGDGVIGFEEFKMPPRGEVRFLRADADGDGDVTREELDAMINERFGGVVERFDKADLDNDGVVTASERKRAMFERIDANGDGQLDTEELLQARTSIREQMKERGGAPRERDGD